MSLIELKIKKAKPKTKPYKLSDGDNLVLVVRPSGSKAWKQRVYRDGKERDVSLGTYPTMGLSDARRAGAEARDVIASGVDPVVERRRAVARDAVVSSNTFRAMTEAYIKTRSSWSASTRYRFQNRMKIDVFPVIGDMPIGEIEPLDLVAAVQSIVDRGSIRTAKRVVGFISQVLDYAVMLGLCKYNPAVRLGKVLGDTSGTSHRPALIAPDDLHPFLQALWGLETRAVGKPLVQACLYTFARPGEVRHMRWSDLDLEQGEWVYHVSKVAKDAHIVPLSDQMIALINRMRVFNGECKYVFAGPSGRAVTDFATSRLIDRLGYKGQMTAHGARCGADGACRDAGLHGGHGRNATVPHAARYARASL